MLDQAWIFGSGRMSDGDAGTATERGKAVPEGRPAESGLAATSQTVADEDAPASPRPLDIFPAE